MMDLGTIAPEQDKTAKRGRGKAAATVESDAAAVLPLDAPHPSLPALAVAINNAVCAAENGAKSAMEHALQAGALLREAKALVEHGQWQAWLECHCDVAPRTAQAYMRLSKKLELLPASKAQRVADLPVREAVKAIATAPTAPPVGPAARAPRDLDERNRVVERFRATAKNLREASMWFSYGGDLKPAKVASLRSKLQAILSELDRATGKTEQGA